MFLCACDVNPNTQTVVHLLIATVRASGELAQGQMTSGFKPLVWKTLRKASQDEIDPESHIYGQFNCRLNCSNKLWAFCY